MQSRVLAKYARGRCVIQAVLGDMAAERVDAIVNAADSKLAHGRASRGRNEVLATFMPKSGF